MSCEQVKINIQARCMSLYSVRISGIGTSRVIYHDDLTQLKQAATFCIFVSISRENHPTVRVSIYWF